jgi:hypothetical protein
MKTRLFLTILFAVSGFCKAQDNPVIQIKSNPANDGFTMVTAPPLKADFTKPIIIEFTAGGLPPGYAVNIASAEGAATVQTADPMKFDIAVAATGLAFINISITATGYTTFPFKINNNTKKQMLEGNQAYDYFATTNFAPFKNFTKRYDRKRNIAYFFFDENGVSIGPKPVNIDADDYIMIYMAVPESDKNSYTIDIEGEYDAVDLEIRSHKAIAIGAAQGTGNTAVKYTHITGTFGPFTSEHVTVKFYKDGLELEKTTDIKINKLYHVAIGASFISTSLPYPTFDVAPITSTADNTIIIMDNDNRSLATFNVIFYWKPTIDWIKRWGNDSESNVTTGRDVLKEASFWERLNPTFGVSLNGEWKENFFMGGTFEFARGGNITAGWHYGKVQQLTDRNFVLGEDVFIGTKDDIKLDDTWKWGFFFGITLDTRILNALFTRN